MEDEASKKTCMTTNEPHINPAEIRGIWGKNWKNLFAQVDIASMVVFRIAVGLIMLWEVTRYFDHNWIFKYWIKPKYNFTYWPFDWVSPFEGDGMYIFFYFLGVISVFIAIGFLYRISTVLFFFSFSYIFLLEQARYLNHFYLIVLIAFVMIFIPAHRKFSVDALLFKKIRSEYISAWHLWLMRFMIAIPYFWGGVAKINKDWFAGEPLRTWLRNDTDFPIIGSFFRDDWMILFLSYSGMLLDLLIVPALLYKRTRVIGFIGITLFHLMNARMFTIGIFPWFMIAATLLFFHPSWPRQLLHIFTKKWSRGVPSIPVAANFTLAPMQHIVTYALVFWFALHTFLPLRHWLYPGYVSWTEEGHRFAWHMKLRTKSGRGIFTIQDKDTGRRSLINPENYLQEWQINKMIDRPYLIWQFAQIVKEDYEDRGMNVGVYANVRASLNARPMQVLITPDYDLTEVPRFLFKRSYWIEPMTSK